MALYCSVLLGAVGVEMFTAASKHSKGDRSKRIAGLAASRSGSRAEATCRLANAVALRFTGVEHRTLPSRHCP